MATAVRLLPALRLAAVPRTHVWKAGTRRTFSAKPSLLVKRYTENHEWIELDTNGKIGTIGISEYAATQLGDVVFAELPEMGLEVKKGDPVGAVESVKSASEIYAPVNGTVVETNSLLEEKPGTINKAPEGEGWVAKLEIEDAAEVEKLMSKEDYEKWEKEDSH